MPPMPRRPPPADADAEAGMGAASERFRFQQRAPSPFRTIIASIAKQLAEQKLDCFVASLLAMTDRPLASPRCCARSVLSLLPRSGGEGGAKRRVGGPSLEWHRPHPIGLQHHRGVMAGLRPGHPRPLLCRCDKERGYPAQG